MSYPSDGLQLFGPALPAPFVEHELKGLLTKRKLLPKSTGKDAKALEERWQVVRRKLGMLGEHGLGVRVRNHVLEPLLPLLGYSEIAAQETVRTREGDEDGGLLLKAEKSALRAWCWPIGTDLDAPSKRGHAFRFSPARVAQRVLLAKGERFGLLTDGSELRFLLCDPARPESQMVFRLDAGRGGWRSFKDPPESFQLFLALARPEGLAALPELIEQARLHQSRVTKELRKQAREAIEGFLQGLIDHPRNADVLAGITDKDALARDLWREGLAVVYRLLFILKLETAQDPARSFSFASTSAWRNTYSPSTALAPVVRAVLEGGETGGMLEGGLRALFRMFSRPAGLRSSELRVSPLGGMLFGAEETRTVDGLAWGEQAVAALLDRLLWTGGKGGRERVHYGPLDVEDLGRVYEALLELEPGIATEPMCRLRRAKLEVVVPAAQGEPYRAKESKADDESQDAEEENDEAEDEAPKKGNKATVQWIEAIPPGRFFLRVGLGRKASGSYYTPHAFVRFLVQETLGPLVLERSPVDDPQPLRLLELKVLDPAMGSGHFLVEACRFLADKLYEACRSCDERASEAEVQAEKAKPAENRDELLARAKALRERIQALPDPNDELLDYLPSRAPEGEEAGLSQRKAEALCRRLVAVHCLYGVDKNRLAVELAKLTLWLESYAEGLPLTFLDHRLVQGDSLTGPFFDQMLTFPGSSEPLEGPFAQDLRGALTGRLQPILEQVRALESTVGKDVADLERKRAAKVRLDAELQPFITLARVWAGGVMLGEHGCDDLAYERLARSVAAGAAVCVGADPDCSCSALAHEKLTEAAVACIATDPSWARMHEAGALAAPFDLLFAEVFATKSGKARGGFDVVLGNPPWDKLNFERKELIGSILIAVLEATRRLDWEEMAEQHLDAHPELRNVVAAAANNQRFLTNSLDRSYDHTQGRSPGVKAPGAKDLYNFFVERSVSLINDAGRIGLITGGGLLKNTAASGIRRLLALERSLAHLHQFVNTKRLFADLPDIVEFCALVSEQYAHGAETLLTIDADHVEGVLVDNENKRVLLQPKAPHFYLTPGGSGSSPTSDLAAPSARAQSFLTARTLIEAEVGPIRQELNKSSEDGSYAALSSIAAGEHDARRWQTVLEVARKGYLPLRGSRSFRVLDPNPLGLGGKRAAEVSLVVRIADEKPSKLLDRCRYYRFAIRRHVGSTRTNERILVPCVLAPGFFGSDQLMVEVTPWKYPNSNRLALAGVLSSYCAEAPMRKFVGSMISLAILEQSHLSPLNIDTRKFLAHAVLRLIAVDDGYSQLWSEQFGTGRWSENSPTWSWPVLSGEAERWRVRAQIDAVVAHSLGISAANYENILSGFVYGSFPAAPQLCLAAFAEFEALGPAAFFARSDPYWDVPLVAALPAPAPELKVLANGSD